MNLDRSFNLDNYCDWFIMLCKHYTYTHFLPNYHTCFNHFHFFKLIFSRFWPCIQLAAFSLASFTDSSNFYLTFLTYLTELNLNTHTSFAILTCRHMISIYHMSRGGCRIPPLMCVFTPRPWVIWLIMVTWIKSACWTTVSTLHTLHR